MGIRDRLRNRGGAAAAAVAEVEEIEENSVEVVAPTPKRGPKAKAAPVVEDIEDDLEDDDIEDDDDLEDEEVVAPTPKRGPKAKAAPVVVEDIEDDLEDDEVVAPTPKRGPKAKAVVVEKVIKPSSKPSFINSKVAAEKVYEADTWLPRDEYLNRLLPAFDDTVFAGITKTQLKEFLEIFEKATVDILKTNDIYIFGIKSRTVITPPRIYAPRDSGLAHVKTVYHTEINAHRDVTMKLSFDKETRRGTVNSAGTFVEGKFEGKKFIQGTWQDKDTFIPKAK